MIYLPVIILLFLAGLFPTTAMAAPSITNITDNRTSYSGSQIPAYSKFEITFSVNGSVASNYQIPYDAALPSGLFDPITGPYAPYKGISVDAVFTAPDGTTHQQPAFYYQNYSYATKPNQFGETNDWLYPTDTYQWKVRFSPPTPGSWRYKLTARDAGGYGETPLQNAFTVTSSSSKGFIKVSSRDPRYFEFSDGTYFPGLGYNMNYDQVDWKNPILSNQSNFQKMDQNGIQLIRIWLSQWSIHGSGWQPWYSVRNDYDTYMPRTGLIQYGTASTDQQPSSVLTLAYSEESGQQNTNWFDACRMLGGFQAAPAVKPNTNYTLSIRYKAINMAGPRDSQYQGWGFTAKIQNPADGNWHTNCFNGGDPQNGVKITPYGKNSDVWTTLEGNWNSGSNNFLPILYLTLENVRATSPTPYVFIDTISMRETLPSGFGPNIITQPSAEQLTYFKERNAYAFDQVVELARANNVYLRPVLMEKNEVIQNETGPNGQKAEFDNNNFYGIWRDQSAVRWLQRAWWRYVTARWGYSTAIHSWEAVNEADPGNWNHFTQADEMGKFMHCSAFGVPVATGDGQNCYYTHPNKHLVSTSFWSGFPATEFWKDPKFPNIDFADVHQYIPKSGDSTHFYDTARGTYDASMQYGAKQSGVNKPVIRGETGLTDSGTEPGTRDLMADIDAIWLHNFVWGQINPGGMLESYWYTDYQWGDVMYGHIYSPNFDHRSVFKSYYTFISTIPLSIGNYRDLGASTSNADLRIWGQKDTVLNRAHGWVAHAKHTWKNVVDHASISPITNTFTIAGFTPNTTLPLEWWNPYTGVITAKTSISTNGTGVVSLTVTNLSTDTAFKIGDYSTQTSKPGDANGDNLVDGRDYVIWAGNYNKNVTGPTYGDFDTNGIVDGRDYVIWMGNYGK